MPGPLLAPAIVGGAQLLGGLFNSFGQARQNRLSREFQREMYDRQRADQLADWYRTNEYNSPQAQMSRFEAAGLNPHLVYSQGNPGQSGPIPTPDIVRPQFENPRYGDAVGSSAAAFLSTMYDLDIKKAQLDNFRTQNTVLAQEAILKGVLAGRGRVGTERDIFNLDFEREMRGISAEARAEALRQLKTQTDVLVNRDAREAAMNSSNLKEAVERMANLREQRLNYQLQRAKDAQEIRRIKAEISRIRETTSNLQKEGILRDLDIDLRRQGINPNDPMYARVLGRILTGFFDNDETLPDFGGNVRRAWDFIFGN